MTEGAHDSRRSVVRRSRYRGCLVDVGGRCCAATAPGQAPPAGGDEVAVSSRMTGRSSATPRT